MLAGAVLLLAALVAAPVPAPGEGLHTAISSFAGALARNDANTIEALTGDEWQIVEGQGRIVTRAQFLAALRSGALSHDRVQYGEERLVELGDAAVWIARVDGTGRYGGQPFSFTERSSDLWIRRGGRWICVFTQLTPLAPDPAGSARSR